MPSRSEAPLAYVDSDVWLDFLTGDTRMPPDGDVPRGTSATGVFEAIERGDLRLAASSLIVAEVGCHGDVRQGDKDIRARVDTWFTAGSTAWIDVDRYLARKASGLMHTWRGQAATEKRMSAADTVHLAAAVELGCGYLFTQDGGFPIGHTVEGVQVMRPQVVWQESLLDQASGE